MMYTKYLNFISTIFKTATVAIILNFIIFFYNIYNSPLSSNEFVHHDGGLSIESFVQKYGYPFETHTTATQDGYILTLHRIPHGKSHKSKDRPTILIMHGLLMSSHSILVKGESSLPLFLADKGYDVWLGNARGNNFSRKHKTLNPDNNKTEFFDFSWNEIGYYDVPASIDKVLAVTGKKKIFYAGFSQGSISAFVALSERPEYNEKIKLMIGLAPVIYTKGIKSPVFSYAAPIQGFYEWIVDATGMYELFPHSELFVKFVNRVCKADSWYNEICSYIVGIMCGFNTEKWDAKSLVFMLSVTPAGSATKQHIHYVQMINSDKFRKYDHGEAMNLVKYGNKTPPEYNLKNVKVPVALIYGNNDWIITDRNIEKLSGELSNVVYKLKVDDPKFTHADMVIAQHAKEQFFDKMLNVMNKF